MDQELVKSLVTEAVKKNIMVGEEKHQLSESEKEELREIMVNESLGGILKRAVHGASLGAAGGLVGKVYGGIGGTMLAQYLLAAGLINPATVVPVAVGAGTAAGIAMLLYGARAGLALGRDTDRSKSATMAKKLASSIKKRDDLMTEFTQTPEEDERARLKIVDKIERESQKQKQLASSLESAVKTDFLDGVLTDEEKETFMKLIAQAREGRLTYISSGR